MTKMERLGFALLCCCVLSACFKQSEVVDVSEVSTLSSLSSASAPGDDAPELAQLGSYNIGVTTINVTIHDTPDIANFNYITRQTPQYDRTISIDVLYPAQIASGDEPAIYTGQFFKPDERIVPGLPDTFEVAGIAVRDAAPVSEGSFPLVIVSHGLLNSPGVLSGITENLATKGYVVAVIDHGDYIPGEKKSFLRLFPRSMLYRSIDQQAVLGHIANLAEADTPSWASLVDVDNVGLAGFSMGGYGVLNHIGAGYDKDAASFGWVGGKHLTPLSDGNDDYENRNIDRIGAAVAIAPWGAQDAVNIWRNESFSKIDTPLLLIVGSDDDVVGYEDGVKEIFENAVGVDRYMLVFQNALHNLVQIAAPDVANLDVSVWETFEDPTWRKEKLLSVNQHFMTAFFDLHLKGDKSRRAFLDVPTVRSNDGVWAQPNGKYYGDQYADGTNGSEGYWRGFKRRQALGLEMHFLAAGEGATNGPSN